MKNLKEKYPDLVDDRKMIKVLKFDVCLFFSSLTAMILIEGVCMVFRVKN